MKSTSVMLFSFLVVCLVCGCNSHSPSSLAHAIRPQELKAKDWIELGQPGTEHRELERFVGDWNVRISSRATPTQDPEVSQGRSNIAWVLDNRFIEEHFTGSVAGHSYTGCGFFGYEKATRRYVNVWLESLATGVTLMYGSFDATQFIFHFEGTVYDPLLGRQKLIKTRVSFVSKDEFTMSMFEKTPAGEEFVSFDLGYRRVGL